MQVVLRATRLVARSCDSGFAIELDPVAVAFLQSTCVVISARFWADSVDTIVQGTETS